MHSINVESKEIENQIIKMEVASILDSTIAQVEEIQNLYEDLAIPFFFPNSCFSFTVLVGV